MRKNTETRIRIGTCLILLLFFSIGISIGQTGLEGKVLSTRNEPILFGTVALYKNDILLIGTETDLEGMYIFNSLDPGVYTVEASSIGYSCSRVEGVVIKGGFLTKLSIVINEAELTCCGFIIPYEVPLIDVFNPSSGKTFTSKEISRLGR